MASACATCGESHANLPRAFGSHAPDACRELAAPERESGGALASDQRRIDAASVFLRRPGSLPVAHSEDDVFFRGVRLEASRAQCEGASEPWRTADRTSEPPCACAPATTSPGDSATAGPGVEARTRAASLRREVTGPGEHALRRESQSGTTTHRIQQLHDRIAGGGA